MKKGILLLSSLIFLLLSGCSSKINPNEFGTVNAPVSKYKPSEYEINSKFKVLILPFKSSRYQNVADLVTGELNKVLGNYPPVKVKSKESTSIKDEIKLAEEAKIAQQDLGEVNYIIQGKISNITTKSEYHREKRWRDKKGKVHVIKAYYSNEACVQGEMQIIKIPENSVVKTFALNGCASNTTDSKMYDFSALISRAAKKSIDKLTDDLYNFFAKRGYIYEVRKKGDKTIVHTTLGKNDGAKPGLKVYIYTIKITKDPFGDEERLESIKIGEGEISNVVHERDSWVVVDEVSQQIKIGDYVKPVRESWWKSMTDILHIGF